MIRDSVLAHIASKAPFSYDQVKAFYDRSKSIDLLIACLEYSAQAGFGYIVDFPGEINRSEPVQPFIYKENKSFMKPQTVLAGLGWLSVFAIGFLWILRKIPVDALSIVLFVLFFIIALFASAVDTDRKRNIPDAKDIKLVIGSAEYIGDQLVVNPGADGKLYIIVKEAMPAEVTKKK